MLGEQMQLRRELEKEVLSISAHEQLRMGQELHDGLGQELTGLGYLAERLYTELKTRDGAAAQVWLTGWPAAFSRRLGQCSLDRQRPGAVELHPHGLVSGPERSVA